MIQMLHCLCRQIAGWIKLILWTLWNLYSPSSKSNNENTCRRPLISFHKQNQQNYSQKVAHSLLVADLGILPSENHQNSKHQGLDVNVLKEWVGTSCSVDIGHDKITNGLDLFQLVPIHLFICLVEWEKEINKKYLLILWQIHVL